MLVVHKEFKKKRKIGDNKRGKDMKNEQEYNEIV